MKKIAIFVFLFLMINICRSQITFNKHFDFGSNITALANILPTDSCYYATGFFIDTVLQKGGNVFVKFDLDGNVIFTKILVDSINSYGATYGDLIGTGDGNFATLGSIADSLNKAVLIKYSPTGDTLFTRKYLNPIWPGKLIRAVDLKLTENEGFLGTFNISHSPGDLGNDIMVLELDSLGVIEQQYIYWDSLNEKAGRAILDDDGRLVIGASKSNTNQTMSNFTSSSYLFKIDSLGELEWEYESPVGKLLDRAYGIVSRGNGELIIGTTIGIEIDFSYYPGTSSSIFWENPHFFKLDTDQNVVWELEVFDSISLFVMRGIRRLVEVDGGDAFIAAGYIKALNNDDPPKLRDYGWFCKISDDGELVWKRRYQTLGGELYDHIINDLKVAPDGGLISVGSVNSSYIGSPSINVQSWLLKLDGHGCLIPGCEVVATDEASLPSLQLAIYPNPTSDYLNFQLRTDQAVPSASFRIVDANGRMVQEVESNIPKETHIVPVWDWAAGVYFLQYLEGGTLQVSERFVVLK